MKNILHILLLSFGLIINGYSQSQSDLLEKAYKKKSVDMLTQFFDNWTIEIKSNESAYQNDTILEAFKVFKGFYRPTQLSILGGSEWGDSLYMKSKYFLVQTRINKIYFVDRLYYSDKETDSLTVLKVMEKYQDDTTTQKLWIHYDKNGRLDEYTISTFGPSSKYFTENSPIIKDSIIEFYPSIDYSDKKAVYLTNDYQSLINNFLGSSHTELGQGGIMNPARSKGASRKRKAFIDNLITTFYGHWGGYWQLNTYPYVYSITFDKEMKYAKVDFRMVYEGGEALLEKQEDKWVIIHAERTWIE